LYLACWEYVAAQKADLDVYKSLSNYWNSSQKEIFIQAQSNISPIFYVKILQHENRLDFLLDYVRNYNGYSEKYELLTYIGKSNPEDAFTIFKKHFFADEEKMKMDRSGYESLCKKLAYLKNIEVSKEEKQLLVQRLRSIYPNRPAFLDELKKVVSKMGL
jgi:hypothetical protein